MNKPACITRQIACTTLLACLGASSLSAHEFWLEQHVTSDDTVITLTGHQGEGLLGEQVEIAKNPDATWWFGDSDTPMQTMDEGIEYQQAGNVTLSTETLNSGDADSSLTLAYQSGPAINHYKTFDEFSEFAEAEGLGWAVATHIEQGFPTENFFEVFYRHTKVTRCIGDTNAAIKEPAYFPDWVLLDNPAAENTDLNTQSITLQLISEIGPMPNQPVHVFRRTASQEHFLEKTATNAKGELELNSKPDDQWLVSTTLLQRPKPSTMLETGAIWRSDWIAFRFDGSANC